MAIIGGGPAGLMAAEVLAAAGVSVHVFDAMPSVGRKFLLAGVGGMNITHSEPFAEFVLRYGERSDRLLPLLQRFAGPDVREWVHGLGIATFVGTSGRVFPCEMKAAPLLRAWLHRLRASGVCLHMRHRWLGWDDAGQLRLQSPDGETLFAADATLLALGGGSWSRLGSDGQWVSLLQQRGIEVRALRPSNCGFDCDWSDFFRETFAGQPLKTVRLHFQTANGQQFSRVGECMITRTGIEGSLIYAVSAAVRDEIERHGSATIVLDLLPDHEAQRVLQACHHGRGSRSLASHLQSRLGLKGVKAALLRECVPREQWQDMDVMARAIKQLPLRLLAARPLEEAISSAGGVPFEQLDDGLMLKPLPGVFCAGEMLDWEAPTGGYLLTACLATGRAAADGILRWLSER